MHLNNLYLFDMAKLTSTKNIFLYNAAQITKNVTLLLPTEFIG